MNAFKLVHKRFVALDIISPRDSEKNTDSSKECFCGREGQSDTLPEGF